MRELAYVAAEHGPRATLEALAASLPGTQSLEPRTELLICGTSDTSQGREREAQARIAASARGVPCVVIEDFPGNYFAVRGAKPRLVIVAAEFERRLAREKEAPLEVAVCPNVRYDALRRRLAELRRPPEHENAVLWIGQPETGDSLETLTRLLPAFAARDATVWFRAHPRDQGYSRGDYAGLPVEDMTARPLEECLARRPRLVVTQFSSVAIEAGFWGIPALNALFADVGGARLLEKKGYSIPGWCEAGAAFVVSDARKLPETLDLALNSSAARATVQETFDRYFKVGEEGAPTLINVLYNQGLL